jgi:hypothetical protein
MIDWRAFFFGFVGSIGLEIVRIQAYYTAGGPFPKRYKSLVFWANGALLSVLFGIIAVAYNAQNDIIS